MNPGELDISFAKWVWLTQPKRPGPDRLDAPIGERTMHPAKVPGCQGRPEGLGMGVEQSYELIVPMKVGNRRAPGNGAATEPTGGKE